MAFTHRHFDVQIERCVASGCLSWPKPGEAMSEGSLGGNRCYEDLRRLPWCEARRVYAFEDKCIERILNSTHAEKEYESIIAELANDLDNIGLFGLDIGVASAVLALSSARCIPFTSCNAGAFGGHHAEEYPIVAFYAKMELIPLLLECVEEAGTGLVNTELGSLITYADDIRKMRRFANAIIERSSAFRNLRFNSRFKNDSTEHPHDERQMKLEL